jgi:serine/threonine protein kinase
MARARPNAGPQSEWMMSQLPVGSEFGGYHIVRHIGGGGMAQIYLAKTRGLAGFEKHLALKVINPEYADEDRFVQMLIDEAKLCVGLTHVNIGQVFDLGQIDGIYYIAMEFVDGLDVLELVNGLHSLGEKVPIEAVALIGRQMCSGLHYAHTRKDVSGQPLNIVHRDISPQNILVSRAGEVKVVDFGIAKAAGMSTRTQAGVIKGKVHYMAPEQAMGQKIDHRVDIFSAAIVLWEMLTSQMLYAGDNVRELVEKVRRAAISPPSTVRPEVPPALDFIVMKGLARRVEDRFQSCHEFQIELTKFLSSTAPDYSASHLSALVERVLARKRGVPAPEVELHISKDELIPDVHSVIKAEGISEEGTSGEPHLLVETPQGETPQPLGDELIIGRAGNLAIPDARVSRRHARIYKRGGAYLIEDLGSSNGTFVNEVKLPGPQLLRSGDAIRVGSCRMRFVYSGTQEKASAPRLLLRHGAQCVERPLLEEGGTDLELGYEFQLGPLCLEGAVGRLRFRDGGFWLEPQPGRVALAIDGASPSGPVRLVAGQSVTVGQFSLELKQ